MHGETVKKIEAAGSYHTVQSVKHRSKNVPVHIGQWSIAPLGLNLNIR
jgi:hypothetical protein